MSKHATRAACVVLLALAAGCQGSESPTSPIVFVGPSTLVTTDLRTGQGDTVLPGQQVTVNYGLWLYDPRASESKGTFIENGQAFTIRLASGTVIQGWVDGLPGMKVGGLRRLIIPPDLSFGQSGNGPIPPGAWLVFDVDLLATAD